MAYGGPASSRRGVVEVGFASHKNTINLYILRTDVMNAHRSLLKGASPAMVPSALQSRKRSILMWLRVSCRELNNSQGRYASYRLV
jgi:hypothetical protein